MKNIKENIQYSLLLGLQLMLMCAGFNFVTYYLLEKGITDRRIGILVAVSCTLAVFLQQFAGRLADSGTISGKKILMISAALLSLTGFLLSFFPVGAAVVVLFGLLLCVTISVQPVLHSFTFYYQKAGVSVNFGVARGVGSLCYSGCSFLLGLLTVRMGSVCVPLMFGVVGALILLVLITVPDFSGHGDSEQKTAHRRTMRLADYPGLALMLAGLVLVMLFHNMVMTYFIHVVNRAGGTSEHMGIAIGISGVVEIPVLFLYTKIKGSRSSTPFVVLSGFAFLSKAVLFLFAHQTGMIYAVQCLQCLAFGLMAASRVYYVDEMVGKEHEATGQAYMSATETAGIVLGSALGGFLMQASGIETLLWTGAGICLAGTLCMAASAIRTGGRSR